MAVTAVWSGMPMLASLASLQVPHSQPQEVGGSMAPHLVSARPLCSAAGEFGRCRCEPAQPMCSQYVSLGLAYLAFCGHAV